MCSRRRRCSPTPATGDRAADRRGDASGAVPAHGALLLRPGSTGANGSLLPTLVHGYAPKPNTEFQLILLSGGKFSGAFKTLAAAFTADYTKETASPAFVGAIYDKSGT